MNNFAATVDPAHRPTTDNRGSRQPVLEENSFRVIGVMEVLVDGQRVGTSQPSRERVGDSFLPPFSTPPRCCYAYAGLVGG